MMNMHPHIEQAPRLSAYFAMAAKAPSPLEIEPGSAEWASWELYFDSVYGQRPAAMRLREASMCKHFCVPAQWPEWFDSTFAMDGPATGKGHPWSEDAVVKFLAVRRAADDAIHQGWISALVDFVKVEHRMPIPSEMNEMAADADKFGQRIEDMRSGRFESGMVSNLKALGEAILSRRFTLAKRIQDYRDGMSSGSERKRHE
jgi:hypothetical protein